MTGDRESDTTQVEAGKRLLRPLIAEIGADREPGHVGNRELGTAEATSVVTHCVSALGPPVVGHGGHVVKTLGDGRMAVVDMVDQEKLRPGFHYTPNGVYVHGLGVSRLSPVEFYGPQRQAEPLTVEELQDSIRRVSGTDVTITTMSSGTRWIDTARQATTYRTGRVLLAGDAAHVYAPVGGQGLNVGIVDAANLGWKLAAVVRGWVGEDILDTYTSERHPVAARLLQNTRAQIALMRPDPQTRALWEMFSDLMDLDDAHRYVADMLAGMDVRYDVGDDHRLVGTLCPDMKLTWSGPVRASSPR